MIVALRSRGGSAYARRSRATAKLGAGLCALFLAAGCQKNSPPKPSGPTPPAPSALAPDAAVDPLAPQLEAVKVRLPRAFSPEDFLDITTQCAGIEIKAAAEGKKLSDEPAFRETCVVAPARARAERAIADSNPEYKSTSTHCLSAAIGLEDLIEKGIEKPALEALLSKVNRACGMPE